MRKLMVALVLVVSLGVLATGANAKDNGKPSGDPPKGCHWELIPTGDGLAWGYRCAGGGGAV